RRERIRATAAARLGRQDHQHGPEPLAGRQQAVTHGFQEGRRRAVLPLQRTPKVFLNQGALVAQILVQGTRQRCSPNFQTVIPASIQPCAPPEDCPKRGQDSSKRAAGVPFHGATKSPVPFSDSLKKGCPYLLPSCA